MAVQIFAISGGHIIFSSLQIHEAPLQKYGPHTCKRKAVPGHNIPMVTKFFLISRLCSPMANLYLALIILTLSSSSTIFLSPLFYPWGATNISPRGSCFAGQVKHFQLLVITLFTIFLSAYIHLSWTQAIRTIYRGGFTSTMTLIVSYLSWKKDLWGLHLPSSQSHHIDGS